MRHVLYRYRIGDDLVDDVAIEGQKLRDDSKAFVDPAVDRQRAAIHKERIRMVTDDLKQKVCYFNLII